MSRNIRVVARLDIKNGWLIKGVNMEGWRKVGDPAQFARCYEESSIDEILVVDVVASLYGRNTAVQTLNKIAKDIFIPITAGGGVRKIDDAAILLGNGADKITINSAATENPQLITQIANKYGSQATVVAIELQKNSHQEYYAHTDNGRNITSREAVAWAKEAESRGAGELLIMSIDRDGRQGGFDVSIIKRICDSVKIPVIAGGGLGLTSHISQLIKETSVDGIAIASALHWNKLSIQEIKACLNDHGIISRP